MPTLIKKNAIGALTEEVRKATPDDLVEIYNELSPEAPTTMEVAERDTQGLRAKILEHIEDGLEIEEILDLRRVVFPTHRGVWFDEETKLSDEKDEADVRTE